MVSLSCDPPSPHQNSEWDTGPQQLSYAQNVQNAQNSISPYLLSLNSGTHVQRMSYTMLIADWSYQACLIANQ